MYAKKQTSKIIPQKVLVMHGLGGGKFELIKGGRYCKKSFWVSQVSICAVMDFLFIFILF